jgi:hypothetical protein
MKRTPVIIAVAASTLLATSSFVQAADQTAFGRVQVAWNAAKCGLTKPVTLVPPKDKVDPPPSSWPSDLAGKVLPREQLPADVQRFRYLCDFGIMEFSYSDSFRDCPSADAKDGNSQHFGQLLCHFAVSYKGRVSLLDIHILTYWYMNKCYGFVIFPDPAYI